MPASITNYVPQCATRARRPWAVWLAAAAVFLAVLAAVFAPPLLLDAGHAAAARAVYKGFAAVCHQIPERSFVMFGHPLAVCARCAGLYAGFAAGLLLYPLARPLASRHAPARGWLFAAASPLALDFSLGFFGVWDNTQLSRSLTGALLGAAAVFYVLPGLVDLSQMNRRQFFGDLLSAKGG